MIKITESTSKEIDNIQALLMIAQEYNLECEVIYYALQSMKEKPSLTPTEAFRAGLWELDI